MPWRGHAASWCRRCERNVSECGQLSARYLCAECSETALLENRRQLIAHSGPYFQTFRRSMVAAFGGVLRDDLDPRD